MSYVNVSATSHPCLHLCLAWGGVACGHYFPMPSGHRATVWRLYGVAPATVAAVEAALAVVASRGVVALAKWFNCSGQYRVKGLARAFRFVSNAVELNFDSGGWGGPVCSAYPMALSAGRVFDHVWGNVVAVPPTTNGAGSGAVYVW